MKAFTWRASALIWVMFRLCPACSGSDSANGSVVDHTGTTLPAAAAGPPPAAAANQALRAAAASHAGSSAASTALSRSVTLMSGTDGRTGLAVVNSLARSAASPSHRRPVQSTGGMRWGGGVRSASSLRASPCLLAIPAR